jgi:hypothetical protein
VPSATQAALGTTLIRLNALRLTKLKCNLNKFAIRTDLNTSERSCAKTNRNSNIGTTDRTALEQNLELEILRRWMHCLLFFSNCNSVPIRNCGALCLSAGNSLLARFSCLTSSECQLAATNTTAFQLSRLTFTSPNTLLLFQFSLAQGAVPAAHKVYKTGRPFPLSSSSLQVPNLCPDPSYVRASPAPCQSSY